MLTRSFSGPLEASSPTQRLATVGFAAWLAGGYVVGGYGPWETALQGFGGRARNPAERLLRREERRLQPRKARAGAGRRFL